MPTRAKIIFTGNFIEYFVVFLILFVLSVVTFGLVFPYLIYWSVKYFFTRMEIEIPSATFQVDQSQIAKL